MKATRGAAISESKMKYNKIQPFTLRMRQVGIFLRATKVTKIQGKDVKNMYIYIYIHKNRKSTLLAVELVHKP